MKNIYSVCTKVKVLSLYLLYTGASSKIFY